jgi:hypothetical protein
MMRVSIGCCFHTAYILSNIPEAFREAMPTLSKNITCATRTQDLRNEIKQRPKDGTLMKAQLLNIAFSKDGLKALGIDDDLKDDHFSAGQYAEAQTLGDPGTVNSEGVFEPEWDNEFKHPIDGLILAATESDGTMEELLENLEGWLPSKGAKKAIDIVNVVKGSVRSGPGNEVELIHHTTVYAD